MSNSPRVANGELELWLRFHKPVAQASGSFSQACRSASLGSFSQNAVSTRHSPFAHSFVPATLLAPGACNFPFATPRGGEAPRDAGYHDAVPRRARDAARQALARRLASPAGDARLSALHRGDFGPGPVLPSPAFPPDPCSELLAAGS